jgi:hypothetical protein
VRYTDRSGTTRVGFTRDISLGGMFVLAGTPASVGQDVDVELLNPGGENVRFRGHVVRQKRSPLGVAGSIPSSFGLCLTDVFEEFRALVASL